MNERETRRNEMLRSLLQGLLAPIRQVQESPLQLQIDARGIAQAAWGDLVAEYTEVKFDADWTAAKVIPLLDEAIGRSAKAEAEAEANAEAEEPGTAADVVSAIATWLEEFFHDLRAVDPLAIEVAGLRLEGFDSRAISEGLDTGLRLVNRIVDDIRGSQAPVEKQRQEGAPC